MNERARILLIFACSLTLGACSAEAADVSHPVSVCEPNPEIAPRRLAQNGDSANGIAPQRIAVNGTYMNGGYMNGISLQGVTLTGGTADAAVGATLTAILSDGATLPVVVTSFERKGELSLYGLAAGGENLCGAGEAGIFVPGTWDASGAHHASATQVTFSCMRGVIAKCVTWGYAPWDLGSAMHQACTRMARADYCGTGVSYTKEGTAIDVADSSGMQVFANEPGFLFEAGWNEGGAVCVSRARYEARGPSGEPIVPSCFRSLPTCASLDEAKERGALFANLSRPQSRVLCE
jgi:hypothetical protein